MKALWIAGGAIALAVTALGDEIPAWLGLAIAGEPPGWKPGAASVALLSYGQVDYLPNGKILQTIRIAIRQRPGNRLEAAPPGIPYNADVDRVVGARAWVVSPDGSTVRVHDRRDFVDVAAHADKYFWTGYRVIGFGQPQEVQPGGVLGIEFRIEKQPGIADASWFFAVNVPAVKSVFCAVPASGARLVWHSSSKSIPPPIDGPVAGSLLWERDRAGGVAGDPSLVFLANPMQVSVRCIPAVGSSDENRSWAHFAGAAAAIIEPRIAADESVSALARTLTHGKTSRWDRIRSVADYVQERISYLEFRLEKDSLAGYRPHPPAQVLREGLGDCKDKAALLACLLRSVGERAYVVLVNATNPRLVASDWPSACFDHVIVAIAAGSDVPPGWPLIEGGALGRLAVFDPTDPAAPPGVLPPLDQGGMGLVVARETTGLVAIPAETPEQNDLTRRIDGMIDASGDLKAEVAEVRKGSGAAGDHRARFVLGKEKFARFLQARLAASIPSIEGLTWQDSWKADGCVSTLTYRFTGAGAARPLGTDMFLVRPSLMDLIPELPVWKAGAEGSARIAAHRFHGEVRLRLPEGFSTDVLPKDWHQSLPSISASLAYRMDAGTLVYDCEVSQRACFLDRGEYESLRTFDQKLEQQARRPAILRKLPTPAAVGQQAPKVSAAIGG